MTSRQTKFQECVQFQDLRRLHEVPSLSQRTLKKELDISLGSINYCFQVLMEKGWVRIQGFSQGQHRSGYIYPLTPTGILQETELTAGFLALKFAEYDTLREKIKI